VREKRTQGGKELSQREGNNRERGGAITEKATGGTGGILRSGGLKAILGVRGLRGGGKHIPRKGAEKEDDLLFAKEKESDASRLSRARRGGGGGRGSLGGYFDSEKGADREVGDFPMPERGVSRGSTRP